jgi:hypothetical protein
MLLDQVGSFENGNAQKGGLSALNGKTTVIS